MYLAIEKPGVSRASKGEARDRVLMDKASMARESENLSELL